MSSSLSDDCSGNRGSGRRLHVVYGGTEIVQVAPPSKSGGGILPPQRQCVARVLRTGFGTEQGNLMQGMTSMGKRVKAEDYEMAVFILFL